MSTYSASLVANAFLYKARKTGASVTHMKLQKLVFFLHAWSLTLKGSSYVKERPDAWPYGPVFETLYHELKSFGSSDVDEYLTQMDGAAGERKALIPILTDTEFWGMVEQIWDRYSRFTASQLSTLTHEKGSPWEQTRSAKAVRIDDNLVRDYYMAQIPHAS